jgi:type IX secretion system PorP/SprF family membrane protein
MMRLFICLVIIGISVQWAMGQDIQFSQFYANPIFQNPANAGNAGTPRFIINYRNQWPALGAAFQTASCSFDTQIADSEWGLGAQIINDRQGSHFQNNNLSLQASRGVSLNYEQTAKLYFGLQTTFISARYDANSGVNFADQFSASGIAPISADPLAGGAISKSAVDFAGGVVFEYQPSETGNYWWLGATVHHLGKSIQRQPQSLFNQRLGVQAGLRLPLNINIWQHGYGHESSRDKSLTLSSVFRQQGSNFQLDFGVNLSYSPVMLGVWYRNIPLRTLNGFSQRDALVFLVGFQQDKFMVQYSYDFTVSSLGFASGGAHEMTFWYGLDSLFGYKGKTSGKARSRRCPAY